MALSLGTIETIDFTGIVGDYFKMHQSDYQRLNRSQVPFDLFLDRVSQMQKNEPNYTAEDLSRIQVPVLIAQSEFDEFIKLEHARYLADTLPHADFYLLKGVSHFAPMREPEAFAKAIITFFRGL